MVRKFLIERFMSVHHFHGCMMGVLGNNGQPMKTSWTIAGNFKELSKLDSYRCEGSHEHDQSRGKSFKLAENYTFKLTDMLHECFQVAVTDQASKRKACSVNFAFPVKTRDSQPTRPTVRPRAR